MSDPIYKIEKCEATVTPIPSVSNLEEMLIEQAQVHDLRYLLAFALDGLFWGRFDGEKWDKKSASTQWDEQNVQELRIFGENGEVHLWRSGEGWLGRKIIDGAGDDFTEMIDEKQILWGDQAKMCEKDPSFTLMSDGQQGLCHIIPLSFSEISPFLKKMGGYQPLRLHIRHYLANEDVARIAVSRDSVSECRS